MVVNCRELVSSCTYRSKKFENSLQATQAWQRPHNFMKFEGPVLNYRGRLYLKGLVIDEIRNNASAIFKEVSFQLLYKNPHASAVRPQLNLNEY
jgi:hypothetical protein